MSDARAVKIARTAKQAGSLTPELVHLLIEKILLYPGGCLEVYWKGSAFENTPENMEGMKNAG